MGKDVEGSCRSLFKVQSQNLFVRTEEKQKRNASVTMAVLRAKNRTLGASMFSKHVKQRAPITHHSAQQVLILYEGDVAHFGRHGACPSTCKVATQMLIIAWFRVF